MQDKSKMKHWTLVALSNVAAILLGVLISILLPILGKWFGVAVVVAITALLVHNLYPKVKEALQQEKKGVTQ